MNKQELEKFWNDFIGDSGSVESSSITQIFMRGPFAGHSIREIMEVCIHELGKIRPKITHDHDGM